MDTIAEVNVHLKRNENIWQIWEQNWIQPETEFTINFHFYASKKEHMELLSNKLSKQNTSYSVKETRTLIFLKGWKVEAEITKKWTLAELQIKTRGLVFLSQQAKVSFEGCSASVPKK